jgi:hypothetical protein
LQLDGGLPAQSVLSSVGLHKTFSGETQVGEIGVALPDARASACAGPNIIKQMGNKAAKTVGILE